MIETLCFLCEERTLDRVTEILDGLWPDRVIARTDLNTVTVNERETSFSDERAYLRYVCENPDAEASLYWKVPEASDIREIRGGYFIATADAHLVFGVDVDWSRVYAVLCLLKEKFSIEYAISWGDTYPPDTREEFIRAAENSDLPSLCRGELRNASAPRRDGPSFS